MAAPLPSVEVRAGSAALPSRRIRVLIAEETPMDCQLLKNALSRSRFCFEVVATAVSRSEILHSMSTYSIDVALVGESLSDGPFVGFKALAELRTTFPQARVIALLKSVTHDLVVDTFRAGAKGIFCRAEPVEALCKCIRAVNAGQVWANSQQLNLIVDALANTMPFRVTGAKGKSLLAKREQEVANLVAEGLANRDIAQKLGISEHTVSNYLFRIYEKLGISSRVELVLYIVRQQQPQD